MSSSKRGYKRGDYNFNPGLGDLYSHVQLPMNRQVWVVFRRRVFVLDRKIVQHR